METKLRDLHELTVQKADLERKFLEANYNAKKYKKRLAGLQEAAKHSEELKQQVQYQESVMGQLQLLLRNGPNGKKHILRTL